MKFNKDIFNRITPPSVILRKASGERIGILKTTELTLDVNLNDFNVIQFKTYLYLDNEKNPYYDSVHDMMYIETEDDLYVITNIDTVGEGNELEYKQVTAKTYEWMLTTRYLDLFYINTGTVESIDGVNFESLLHLCIDELFPEWSVGSIYGDLATVQRSFEISRSTVYDFLMNDVAKAFECIFTFDTLNKKINAYPESMYGQNSGVMVSYNNLLKNTDMTLDVTNIKTSLVVTGADDVNIREVSRSNDRIYNFEYYASTEFMSEGLLNAYNTWQALTYNTPVDWTYLNRLYDSKGNKYFVFDNTKDLDGNYIMNFTAIQTQYANFLSQNHLENNYNNLYTFLLNRYQKYFTDLSTWTSTKIPYGNNQRYFGYGKYPTDFPTNASEEVFDIPQYKKIGTNLAVKWVTSLPSTKDENVLYLIKNDTTNYAMYRWSTVRNAWVNTNNWSNIALNPLKEKLKSAENNQSVAAKKGYGEVATVEDSNYVQYYLPYYYSVCALNKAIAAVNTKINTINTCQSRYEKAMECIANLTAMANAQTIKIDNTTYRDSNFTIAQLKELSTFIFEDELSSSNYLVTDIMTDQERFEMLNALLEYGTKELDKVAQPQLTFSAGIVNLFNMPEFNRYVGYIDVGNSIMVSLRDDYFVKPRITNIHLNYYDETDFSLTFSNILRKAKDYYSDVQDALNEAHTAATSVSFNASYWSQQAKNADTLTQHLAAGLLAAGDVLTNGTKSEFLVDERGLFVTTVEGENPKESDTDTKYDSIFIGGGRILFTDDGWKTVKTSLGRGTIAYPDDNLVITGSGSKRYGKLNFTTQSKFGLFADFVLSGYVGGSTIVGGQIYSTNYQTSLSSPVNVTEYNYGTHIDLVNGLFEFNYSGKKRLVLDSNGLKTYGTIYAEAGKIGCSPINPTGTGWTIGYDAPRGYIYSDEKSTINVNKDGLYLGTDGIAMGKSHNYGTTQKPLNYSLFTVLPSGAMYAQSAYITGTVNATSGSFGSEANKMIIGSAKASGSIPARTYIYSNLNGTTKADKDANATGVYLGTDGIGLGGTVTYNHDYNGDPVTVTHSRFMVDNQGHLWCQNAVVQGAIYADHGTFRDINTDSDSFYINEDGDAYVNKLKYKDYKGKYSDTSFDTIWRHIGNQEGVNEYLDDFINWILDFLYNINEIVHAAAPGDRPRKANYKNTYDESPIG